MRHLRAAAALFVLATSMSGAAAANAKACRYARIGSMPIEWQDARLRVHGTINGKPVPMIVDTGATNIVIPNSLVEPLGLPVIESVKREAYGAGGITRFSLVRTWTMSIGDVKSVGELMRVDLDSALREVLVGDEFLFQHDLELNDHEMAFFLPLDCGDASLAYWDPLTPFAALEPMDEDNPQPVVRVTINGTSLRALVDTGATNTVLDLAAARKLGVDPSARGIKTYDSKAIGKHDLSVWPPEQFDTFEIGGEIVRHPHLAIANIFGHARDEMSFAWWKLRNAPDMILGADFLRAHRLLFARSQRRLYVSYNGGNIFNAPTASDRAAPQAASTVP